MVGAVGVNSCTVQKVDVLLLGYCCSAELATETHGGLERRTMDAQ